MLHTVRWVGHPLPFERPEVQRRLIANAIRPADLVLLRWIDEIRISALTGHSAFSVGLQDGFSRHYQFGPFLFEQEMVTEDVDRLTRNPWERAMFEVDGRRSAPPDWYEHAPAHILAKKAPFLRRELRRIPTGR